MNLHIDPSGRTPVYEQIREQLATRIATADLPAGTKLPTIRALAAQLGLAVNTVAHAYRELESAGLIVTRPRHGTIVATGDTVKARLREAALAYVSVARQLGVTPEVALQEVDACLKAELR